MMPGQCNHQPHTHGNGLIILYSSDWQCICRSGHVSIRAKVAFAIQHQTGVVQVLLHLSYQAHIQKCCRSDGRVNEKNGTSFLKSPKVHFMYSSLCKSYWAATDLRNTPILGLFHARTPNLTQFRCKNCILSTFSSNSPLLGELEALSLLPSKVFWNCYRLSHQF